MRLEEIASVVLIAVKRDAEFESLGMVTHAMPNMLVFLENKKFLPRLLRNPHISCIMTTRELAASLPEKYGVALSDNPRRTFYEFHNYLVTETNFYWSEFDTNISDQAEVHPSALIAEKDVRIGRGTLVEPGVIVLGHSIIGENVVLRAGCTIGSHGFEFKRIGDQILPVVHAGGVLLHNRVEIQNNSNVDRSVFGGFTEIGEDTKIDTLVHVGHNVRIGKRCLIAATTVIGGSTTVGDDVWIGPGATISTELVIGDRASITLGSVVTKDALPGQKVTGNFAIEHHKFIKFIKSIR